MMEPATQQTRRTIYPNYHEDTSLAKHTFDISDNYSIKILKLISEAFDLAHESKLREVNLDIILNVLSTSKLSAKTFKSIVQNKVKVPAISKSNEKTDIVMLSTDVKKILLLSYLNTQKLGRKIVEIEDLILSIVQFINIDSNVADIDIRETEKRILNDLGGGYTAPINSGTPTLNKYSIDITELASTGQINEVIGREEEIQRVIQILTRQTKSNAVLLGEPGVGKTAIVEGIAKMIAENTIVDSLREVRILSLNLVSLLSAASRGGAEDIMQAIIDEAKTSGNIILFIDELHTITGGGNTNEANSIANILKPSLARGEIHVIGATTLAEYRKYMEKDPALSRRFEPVKVNEPSVETTIKILTGVAAKLEQFHNVTINDATIEASIKLSKRYIQDRFLPDKAIDLLDEASSKIVLEGRNTLTPEDISTIVSDRTGIPVTSINTDDQTKLSNLEETLGHFIIGQPHAVHVVSEAIRRARAKLKDPNRPTGSFLFLGPSGVGKTELAKVLAREIYNTEKALIRIDMSEFSEQHTVQRLVGAPPGYVGYDEGGQLTNPVWEQPYSLVLLDEIEKAHPKVFDIFLQVLDDGRLTDGQGRTVDFRNTIIIATSNVAADEIMRIIEKENDNKRLSDPDFIQKTIIPILRDYFRPEFINRFDEVVVFNPLGIEELVAIAKLQIIKVQDRLKEQNISLSISDETLHQYAKEAYNPAFGARPLKRMIQDRIENRVAKEIVEGKLQPGSTFTV